jgi:hypothetical protein
MKCRFSLCSLCKYRILPDRKWYVPAREFHSDEYFFSLSGADSAEGCRPSTGHEKRSAQRGS